MKKFPIILFAGFAGAGKTTLSRSLSKRLDFSYIEHQKVVHELAASKGYSRARYWLKDAGVKKFIGESTDEMVHLTREAKHVGLKGVILDVVYGDEMVDGFKNAFPEAEIVVIGVEANRGLREERIALRMGGVERAIAEKERGFRDKFLTEVGLRRALLKTDFNVENAGSLEELESRIEARLINLGVL